ncbi:MAG: CPBP family intramembrane glutamic endopeptidase [Gammaproteobacteria bacterium]
MRPVIVFLLACVGIIVLGAILAGPVYELFPEVRFSRVASRTTLLLGLPASLFYLAWQANLSLGALGYETGQRNKAIEFCNGFVLGLALLMLIELSLLGLGVHAPDSRFDLTLVNLGMVLLKGLSAGLVVALIEETIFRGALYGGLRANSGAASTILAVSLVYAAVHYLKYPELRPQTVVGWSTGPAYLPQALGQFSQPVYYDAMLTLFILGCLFGILRHFSGSIISCIGLHTAIVMLNKTVSKTTDYVATSEYGWLANPYQTTQGYVASFWLLVFCVACYLYAKRHARRTL